ncbi:DUF6538 domain-containing protein [Bosea psychrotolerans]|uniref:Phage integrase family protein n=1 Tax=Bosea psychrotolerans TaxID=1871628 RepID=A0A2S4LRN9_9HYPH|nr:DUF6538 domain-containing protein [Bosea psychrotolerans]POR45065.1 phage integrase family protein [Bosea psychrotolerans]
MVLSMARPFKHPKTGVYWFRKAVPKDLREALGKTEFIQSLRTKDVAEARKAHAELAAVIEARWGSLRGGTQRLTTEQIAALAGEVYQDAIAAYGADPGEPEGWEGSQDLLEDALDTVEVNAAQGLAKLEKAIGSDLDGRLGRRGLRVDADTRERVLLQVALALHRASGALRRRAQGDYSPDPGASRFPEWKATEAPKAVTPAGKTSLTGILADWWKEAQATGRKPSTHESYSNTVDGFVAFLGHDDATQVTPGRVVGFKDHRLASINPRTKKPISPKTVKDSDLSALKTLFGWGVSNHRLPSNPAAGITIKLGKRKVTRPKGFTDEEAEALLKAAEGHQQGNEQPKTFAAKRWVPWLCAYTGARVGEVAQLRKQDVRKVGGYWVIHITPDAGTVKTDQARDVVLHEHLVAQGFPEFCRRVKDGHLFLTPADGSDVLGPLQGLKNRLAETARDTVKDTRVQPNHGWRHGTV